MKKIFFLLGATILFFTTKATVFGVVLDLPDFLSAESPANLVNNIYLYSLGIAGTLAVIMIVYGGIKYTVSAGNTSSQDDAKDIIKSSIWGLVLLGGAFVVLNTINPSLTELSNPGLVDVDFPPGGGGGTISDQVCGDVPLADGELTNLAYQLKNSGVHLSTYATCISGSDPQSIINTLIAERYPYVCANGCKPNPNLCSVGGMSVEEDEEGELVCTGTPIVVKKDLLQILIDLRDETKNTSGTVSPAIGIEIPRSILGNYTLSSLTGGDHSPNSAHYQGRAADITPSASFNSSLSLEEKTAVWLWYVDTIRDLGAPTAFFDILGTKFEDEDIFDLFESNGELKDGAHIHIAI